MTGFRLPDWRASIAIVSVLGALLAAVGWTYSQPPGVPDGLQLLADSTAVEDESNTSHAELPVRSIRLGLPTDNDALLRGDGSAFYMYTNRNFNGVRSTPWEAGQFGFVRNPKQTRGGVVFTRYHGGVDIRPVQRDRQGNPLDRVRAIADGEIVYVNNSERNSSYGLYVVLRHVWNGAPYYSLYAHLNEISVGRGQHVRKGDDLGLLGFTGTGINRARAHLHLEINMLMNSHFQQWFDAGQFRTRNHHGNYNGLNMMGLDTAELFLALEADSTMTIPDFVRSKEIFYEVAIPYEGPLDILYRYPWLLSHAASGDHNGWIISFTQSGLPVRITPSTQRVSDPTVIDIRQHNNLYADLTRGLVEGRGQTFKLSDRGLRHIDLVAAPVRQ